MGRTSTRRQEILDTATHLFATRGYGSVSIADLADALSTSKAAIYYHFNFKQELLATIVTPLIDDLRVCLAGNQPTPEALLREYIDALLGHREALQILMGDVGAVMATPIGKTIWENHERFVERLRDDDGSLPSLIKAAAVSGAVHAVGGWSLRDEPPEAIRSTLLETCLKLLS